jgi:pimeloyl-ACP methyl ester carboxylesterase
MKIKNTLIILLLTAFLFHNCATGSKENKTEKYSVFKSNAAKRTYIRAYNNSLKHLWPVDFEERDIKTSFGIAHVIICGPKDGKPLILMHGLNASSTMWYPNIKALSAKNRVYAIDFILEPGKSIPQKKITTKDEMVNWYNEIFDHLKFKKISIVGASRGGWIALNLALEPNNKIEKLILLSPAQALVPIPLNQEIFSNIDFALFPRRARLKKVLKTLTYDVENLEQVYINQFYIASRQAGINKSIFKMIPFGDDELKSLNMPVLVLDGERDIINNDQSLARAKKMIPKVQADIVPRTGHFLSFDQPEIVNKRILNFLDQ